MVKQFREVVYSAPPLGQAQIPRPHLLRRAALGLERRLLLVTGPAGYGKTSLLSGLAESERERVRTAWCPLRPEQADPQCFLASLYRAVRDGAQDSHRHNGRSRGSRTNEEILDALSELLRSWRDGRLLLVLDDYETIRGSEPANAVLQQLIRSASDRVCFAIASREAPGFPIARLRAGQELLEIAQQDLAFSEEETCRLMVQQLGFRLTPEDLAVVHRACQGWPAGLVMVAESMRSSSPARVLEILRANGRPPQHIYDYFAEEVLLSQPPHVQEFLLKTSVLEPLDPETCDRLLDSADHGPLLEDLRRRGIFLTVSEPGSSGLHYHDLFRSFLSAQLRERMDLTTYRELHRHAALVYEERGQWDLAVRHYSQAGQPEAVASIILRVGPVLADRGLLDTIQAWLSHLPKEWLGERPELHVVLGTALWRHGDRITALTHLEVAHRLARARGSASGVASALYQIARSDLAQGQPAHAVAALQEAIDLFGQEAPQAIGALAIQGLGQLRSGATGLARETSRRAVALAKAITDPEARAEALVRALRCAAVVDLHLDDLDLAVSKLRESLALGYDRPALANDLRWNKYALAGTLLRQGEFEAATTLFGEAGWDTADLPAFRREWASHWVGEYWYAQGDCARAEAAYQIADRFGLKDIAFLRLQTGHCAEGLRLAKRSWQLAERGSDLVARADTQAVLGIAHHSAGQSGAAVEWLQEAASGFERMGLLQRLASAQLWLAHLAAGEDDLAQADRWLAIALGLARQRSFYYFFWWSAPAIAWACARGFYLNLERHYLRELIWRRFDVPEARSLLALSVGNLAWRGTIAQILRLLADRMPNLGPIHEDLLTKCGDDVTRRHLIQAVSRGEISPWGLKLLRQAFELSWREIEVFHAYFLAPLFEAGADPSHYREQTAERLQMTANTLGTHLRRIRQKLDLPERSGALYILRWATERGILEWSTPEDPF